MTISICFNYAESPPPGFNKDFPDPTWNIDDFYRVIEQYRYQHKLPFLQRWLPLEWIANKINLYNVASEHLGNLPKTPKQIKEILKNRFNLNCTNLKGFELKQVVFNKYTAKDILGDFWNPKENNPFNNPKLNMMGISILQRGLFYYIYILFATMEEQ